jgi:hypothetical protein
MRNFDVKLMNLMAEKQRAEIQLLGLAKLIKSNMEDTIAMIESKSDKDVVQFGDSVVSYIRTAEQVNMYRKRVEEYIKENSISKEINLKEEK